MYRYPFTPFPNSWFRVAFSDEVRAGRTTAASFLGRKILLVRDGDAVRALGATCPHLGADLSGSPLAGGQLECPFHGWRFDLSGACAHIPYCERIPKNAQLPSWPVRELNGMIFVFHHAERAAPQFELPDLPELRSGEWSRAHRLRWKIRMHVQEIIENAVDLGHFAHVHAYREYPRNPALTVDGHRFRVSIESERRVLGIVSDTSVEITYQGMGCAVARIRSRFVELTAILTPTPIDDQTLDVGLWLFFKKTRNPFLDFLTSVIVPRDIRADFANDIPIWERKAYLQRPLLCAGDGPIMKIRHWAKQFYDQIPPSGA
jgi:nitrite reductase/ring-hydroxylating ferredoxin subunit